MNFGTILSLSLHANVIIILSPIQFHFLRTIDFSAPLHIRCGNKSMQISAVLRNMPNDKRDASLRVYHKMISFRRQPIRENVRLVVYIQVYHMYTHVAASMEND